MRRQFEQLIARYPQPPVKTLETGIGFEHETVRVEKNRVHNSATGWEGIDVKISRGANCLSAVVIPQLPDGRLVLAVRYRYATGRWCAEFPRILEISEDLGWRDVAAEQLQVTLGLSAASWRPLGGVNCDPELMTTTVLVLLAEDCRLSEELPADNQELVAGSIRVTPAGLDELIRRGDVECGVTLSALCLFRVFEAPQFIVQ